MASKSAFGKLVQEEFDVIQSDRDEAFRSANDNFYALLMTFDFAPGELNSLRGPVKRFHSWGYFTFTKNERKLKVECAPHAFCFFELKVANVPKRHYFFWDGEFDPKNWHKLGGVCSSGVEDVIRKVAKWTALAKVSPVWSRVGRFQGGRFVDTVTDPRPISLFTVE